MTWNSMESASGRNQVPILVHAMQHFTDALIVAASGDGKGAHRKQTLVQEVEGGLLLS